jgi:hypothetical protein
MCSAVKKAAVYKWRFPAQLDVAHLRLLGRLAACPNDR